MAVRRSIATPYDAPQLSQIVAEIRRPYLPTNAASTSTLPYLTVRETRDTRWDRWRDIRHRRIAPWLPEKARAAFGFPLYYRDTRVSKLLDEIAARLGANDVKVAVGVIGDHGSKMTQRAETYEAWLRGVRNELDPWGLHYSRNRKFQASGGVGAFELEFLQGYVPPMRNGRDDKEYDAARDQAARECAFPVRLNTPDPRSLYWPAGQERPSIVVKVVNKPLIDVQNLYAAEGFTLGYEPGDGGGKIKQQYIVGGEMPPTGSSTVSTLDVGKYVRCVVVADESYIYHLVSPTAMAGPASTLAGDSPGAVEDLMLLAKYPNPLGHPPFYLTAARTTEDVDPGYHYIPLGYEALELTGEIDAVRSLIKIEAYQQALAPHHAKPRIPAMGGEPTAVAPKDPQAMVTPGILEYDGEIIPVPGRDLQHLLAWEDKLLRDYERLETGIRGALKSGEFGKSSPAWAMMMYKEEETAFLKEALDSTASATQAMLEDITTLMKQRYATSAPVYVRADTRNKKTPEAGHLEQQIGMSAQDFDGPFRISVSIDAQTQSQRAAETEYGRRLLLEGTISHETYETDYVGVEDRLTEEARKQRESLKAKAAPFVDNVSMEMAKAQLRAVFGPIADIVLGPPPDMGAPGGNLAPPPPAPPPEGELPGEEQMPAFPEMPGLGMSDTLPAPAGTNGAFPVMVP